MTNAPERILAYNSLQTGYRFTAKGPQPHFDGVEYIRADLMAELVDALRIAGPIALKYLNKHPFIWDDEETHEVAVISAALYKIKETTK